MQLIVCNSGSDGNTYLLNSDTDCVVLDCGVNFKTVMKTLDFNIKKIRFAVSQRKKQGNHLIGRRFIKKILCIIEMVI